MAGGGYKTMRDSANTSGRGFLGIPEDTVVLTRPLFRYTVGAGAPREGDGVVRLLRRTSGQSRLAMAKVTLR